MNEFEFSDEEVEVILDALVKFKPTPVGDMDAEEVEKIRDSLTDDFDNYVVDNIEKGR